MKTIEDLIVERNEALEWADRLSEALIEFNRNTYVRPMRLYSEYRCWRESKAKCTLDDLPVPGRPDKGVECIDCVHQALKYYEFPCSECINCIGGNGLDKMYIKKG